MAGKHFVPLLAQILIGLFLQGCSLKWKLLSKKDKGRRPKTFIRCPWVLLQCKRKQTITEGTYLFLSKGDEQREEKTKEEMQKNVLSIRGEDRRYWKYMYYCPDVIKKQKLSHNLIAWNLWRTNCLFQNFHGLSSQWLCLGAHLPRGRRSTSAKKSLPRTWTLWLIIISPDTRRHGQYSAWTGRWGRTRGSDWLLAPLSRSTTTRSRWSGGAWTFIACRPIETIFDI